MKIKVDCDSECEFEEAPKRFWIKQKEIRIEKILTSWITPEARHFKVVSDDNDYYTIELNTTSLHWELVSFTHGTQMHGSFKEEATSSILSV